MIEKFYSPFCYEKVSREQINMLKSVIKVTSSVLSYYLLYGSFDSCDRYVENYKLNSKIQFRTVLNIHANRDKKTLFRSTCRI